MYISSLTVKDYRSIDYVHLRFSKGKNVIVGKNNAGKSNIIKSLELILGDKSPSYCEVSPNDFHCEADKSCESFWILCTLKGDDIDEDSFLSSKGQWKGNLDEAPFIRDPLSDVLSINTEHALFNPDEYYENGTGRQKRWVKGNGNLSALRDELCHAYWLGLLLHVSKSEVDDEEYHREFRLFYQPSREAPYSCIWNISNKLRDSLLTCAILPAFREPATQLRINNYSWYGKLLKKAWDARRQELYEGGEDDAVTLHDKLHEAYDQVNKVGALVFGSLTEDIKRRLDVAFKDIELAFHFFVSKGEVHKQTQIFVNDGFDSLLGNKGSGIQSAIIIGLFSYYCSQFHSNTTLLAIEEPELYLHPQARRVMSHRLSEFVNMHCVGEETGKLNQVVITTHSSEFIRAGEVDNISVVRKVNGKTIAANYTIDQSDKKIIQTLLKSENSEMFFADKVIICEGGEKHILPAIADYLSGRPNTLDENNISIVRANGKGDIAKYVNILKKCDIQYFVIADLDYLFYGLDSELDPEINKLRKEASEIIAQEANLFKANRELKKALDPTGSINAKEFCSRMELLKEGGCEVEYVLDAWDLISSKVKTKINRTILEAPENADFRKRLTSCLEGLWTSYDIYILNNGELEDYLSPLSIALPGSKDTKLLEIVDKLDSGGCLEDYVELDEFKVFLADIIQIKEPSGVAYSVEVVQEDEVPVSTATTA